MTSCLRCADLHRRDADPRWPRLAAQLTATEPPASGATVTCLLTAATAAVQVLAYLDGGGRAGDPGRDPRTASARPACRGSAGGRRTPRAAAGPRCGTLRTDARATRAGDPGRPVRGGIGAGQGTMGD